MTGQITELNGLIAALASGTGRERLVYSAIVSFVDFIIPKPLNPVHGGVVEVWWATGMGLSARYTMKNSLFTRPPKLWIAVQRKLSHSPTRCIPHPMPDLVVNVSCNDHLPRAAVLQNLAARRSAA